VGGQYVNMLLNVFHGVVANAAYGIMTQVPNAMNQFASNFFTAVNPQITKSYAKGDMDYLYLSKVYIKSFIVALVSVPLPIFICLRIEGWTALFATTSCFILPFLFSAVFFGFEKNERTMVLGFIKKRVLS